MGYELRIDGHTVAVYAHPDDALDRARVLMKSDTNVEPEVLDTRTGRACELAASIRWRDELAAKMGY